MSMVLVVGSAHTVRLTTTMSGKQSQIIEQRHKICERIGKWRCAGSPLPVSEVPAGVSKPLWRRKDRPWRPDNTLVTTVSCRRHSVPLPRDRLQTRGLFLIHVF